MIANCAMWCGLHSLLAPTSRSIVGRPDFVGKSAASAGRSTPGSIPMTIFAVAIAAPVLPAETKPSACPSATRRAPTLIELRRLRRTAVATASSIRMTSGASASSTPLSPSLRQPQRRSSGSTTSRCPTRMTRTPKSRVAANAPSISGCGARSLPIASTTTLPVSFACLIKDSRRRPPRRAAEDRTACRARAPAPAPAEDARLRLLLDLQDLAPLVVPALRADPVRQARLLAVRAEHGLGREHYLLAHQLAQVDGVALVGREPHVGRQQLDVLGLHGLGRLRDEGRVELDLQRQPHGGEAAVARDLDLGVDRPAQANLLAPAPGVPLDRRR